MLPEELSNGICSLNPDKNRLSLSLKMKINDMGKVVDYKIYKAIISSNYRLIYDDVNDYIDGNKKVYDDEVLLEKLDLFNELYKILYISFFSLITVHASESTYDTYPPQIFLCCFFSVLFSWVCCLDDSSDR